MKKPQKAAKRAERNKVPYEFLGSVTIMLAVIGLAIFVMVPRNRSFRFEEAEPTITHPSAKKSEIKERSHLLASRQERQRESMNSTEREGEVGSRTDANPEFGVEANVKISQALTFVDTGEWEKGEAILKDILKQDPRNEQALIELAVIQIIDKHDSQAAIPLLEKALSINPNNEEAMQELVTTYMETGRLDTGLKYLQTFAEEHPESQSAQFGLASTLYDMGRIDEANDTMQKLIGRAPDDKAFQYAIDLADMNAQSGRTDKAIEGYQEAVIRAQRFGSKNSDASSIYQEQQAMALMKLGTLYQESGQPEKARQVLEKMEREFPQRDYTTALRSQIGPATQR